MKTQNPTIGPIIGYTTDTQVRIWLRGSFQKTEDGYRRCFAVAQVRINKPGEKFGEPFYTKAVPHFDMTGVCVFQGLQPDMEYEYQAGWFFAETSMDNIPGQEFDWTQAARGKFRTSTDICSGCLAGSEVEDSSVSRRARRKRRKLFSFAPFGSFASHHSRSDRSGTRVARSSNSFLQLAPPRLGFSLSMFKNHQRAASDGLSLGQDGLRDRQDALRVSQDGLRVF